MSSKTCTTNALQPLSNFTKIIETIYILRVPYIKCFKTKKDTMNNCCLILICVNQWHHLGKENQTQSLLPHLTLPAGQAVLASSSDIDASSAHSLIKASWICSPQTIPPATCKKNNNYYYMASSSSGQCAANSVFWLATWAGKMEWYCSPRTARFIPTKKISPKFKRVHESFLSPKLFSAKVKRFFCDFSVFM